MDRLLSTLVRPSGTYGVASSVSASPTAASAYLLLVAAAGRVLLLLPQRVSGVSPSGRSRWGSPYSRAIYFNKTSIWHPLWGFSSVVERALCMREATGSIPVSSRKGGTLSSRWNKLAVITVKTITYTMTRSFLRLNCNLRGMRCQDRVG